MRKILSAFLVAAAALAARGESADVDSVTLGAMAEHADLVVVARSPAADAPASAGRGTPFEITERLRESKTVAGLRVVFPASLAAGPPKVVLLPGRSYLLFLRSLGGDEYEPVALPWGMRDTSEAGIVPLVEYTRRYAASLAADGTVSKPADLVALLVESLASRESGVPTCAGRDLLRHQELVPSMTEVQRLAVDAALAVPRKADADLAAIVDAAGLAGTAASEPMLVARLLDPAARGLRLNITAALKRHARAEVVALLASRVEGADPVQRADLVNALGRLDRAEAAPFLLKALADPEPDVRVEAAHSAGLLARAVRAPKDGVDAEAPREKLTAALVPLVAGLAGAKTDSEKRALLWAVAQIDTQEAWAELRKLRDESKDARVRELAAHYLLHPRVELILEN